MTLPKLGYSCTKIGSGKTPLGGSEVYVASGVTFLRSQNVHNDGLRLDDVVKIDPAVDAEMAISRVKPGDVLFNITGASIGRCCLVPETLGPANVNQHVCIIRPSDSRYGPYVAYALQSPELQSQISASLTGAARDGVTFEQISNLRLPLWDPESAWRIGTYLDSETAHIDSLIGQQERLIELLAEKRQAIITHAVTKGLDPTAPTKPSGVHWLGDIPAHWECKQIKWLTQVRRGASPRPIDNPVYFDENGEWSWVRIADVSASDGTLTSTTQRLSDLGSSLSVKLEPGSLFVSIAGTVGKPCINQIKACIHDGFVYFPSLRIHPQYLFRIFEAGRCYEGLGKMGTQLNLNTDTIGSIYVPVPPEREIEGILKALSSRLHKLDALSSKITQFREKLIERRAALISAAVTGKMNVTNQGVPA